MNKQIVPYFALIFGMFCTGVSAQSVLDSIYFQHIKTGLAQSSATEIYEDSHGFLWIGTPNGLNKYDGTEFQLFEKSVDGESGLNDGYVEDIYEDEEGLLYFGTNKGLNIYDRNINTVKSYPFKSQGQILQTKYIGAISKSGNSLWLGTDNEGVYQYNILTGETKQIIFDDLNKNGPTNRYIVELFPIEHDKLLMITQASVYVINNELQVVSQINGNYNIRSAIRITDYEYLLGSNNGEFIELSVLPDYNLEAKSRSISPGHSVLSMARDAHGNIWLGIENDGLTIYSPRTGEFNKIKVQLSKPNSISSNSIWSIHKASNGVMWLGPFKNGLSFYDPEYFKFKLYKTDPFDPNSLSNNLVNSFLEADDGNLWIGTDGGGLNYWDRKKNRFEVFSEANGKLHADVVLSLLKDNKGQLWVGSWAKGVAIMDPKTKKFKVLNTQNSFLGSNNVTDMLQDKLGRIWIVTLFGGVHVYYPDSGRYQHVSMRSEKDGSETITVARILEDKEGQIWVGSQTAGLFRLAEENDKWIPVHYHSFAKKRPISNDFVNTIVQDRFGDLWVGTQVGLNKFVPETDSFETFTKKDGLINDAIKGIIVDKQGNLWLSTGNGIIKYDEITGTSEHYNIDDGLQGNEFNASSCYLTSDDELVFGGSNGFNIFRPDQVQKRQDVPEVFISGLRIFNKVVEPNDEFGVLKYDISQTDTLELDYHHDVVNFEFHTLTYRHPERVNYAYFLEGFESEWNYVGDDNNATYTNLSPGDYTLRIKSTNSDGVWVDNETSLVLHITPPIWLTWWFQTLVAISLLLAFYLTYRFRVRSLKRYQLKLERKIHERTRELQSKHKKLMKAADELTQKNEEIQRFAYAVSHDLKSPINGIKGITNLIPFEIDMKKHAQMEEYVQYIEDTCDTMSDLIADITKIARIGKIENKNELLNSNHIIRLAQNLVHGRITEKKVNVYIEDKLPSIHGDRNRIIRVFENLIDNAVKYMGEQKDPVIRIEAKQMGDFNRFLVIDNGSGMDDSDLEKLFTPFERFHGSVEGSGLGLFMVKRIIESHEGTIMAESAGKGRGTTFVVSFPVAKQAKNEDADEENKVEINK